MNGIYFMFIPFALIAAAMAYLITYNEWMRHYPTKKQPRKHAFEAATFTFIVFAVLVFFVLYAFNH